MNKPPKRTTVIKLDGDYEGLEFTAITSIPLKYVSYIQSGHSDLIHAALVRCIVSWNFTDDEGEPLPSPGTMIPALDLHSNPVYQTTFDKDGNPVRTPIEFPAVAELEPQLLTIIIQKISEEMGRVPNG